MTPRAPACSPPEVLDPTVDRLAELAGGGRALEFAIGTGRVAVPLAERGVPRHRHRAVAADDRPAAHARSTRRPSRSSSATWRPAARRASSRSSTWSSTRSPTCSPRPEQVACFRNAARHLGARRPVRDRAVGARAAHAAARARAPRSGTSSPATSAWTPTTSCTSMSSRTTSVRRGPGGAALPQPAPLHLAGRARPDGPARRIRAGEPARGLGRRGVHRRLPLARVGLPPRRLAVHRCQRPR